MNEDVYQDDELLRDYLSEEELLFIQEEYRRKRLKKSLIGPVLSTVFHVALIIILSVMTMDNYKESVPEFEVKMV